jgi:tetratricopeptide (TPR) repeat protein
MGDIDNYIWAIYQYISLAPNEANPYDSRADLYAFSGKIDKAIKSYEKALERKHDYYPSLVKLGHMYLFKGDYEQAEAHYQIAIASEEPDYRSAARHYMAVIPAYRGRFGEALETLDEGLAVDRAERYERNAYTEKFGFRARILAEMGKFDEALAEVDKGMEVATRVEGGSLNGWRHFKVYLLAMKGDLPQAEVLLAELRTEAQDGDDPEMLKQWVSTVWVKMMKGNLDEACAFMEKAGQGKMDAFIFQYHLALVYLSAGRTSESVAAYERTLRRYSEKRAWFPILAAKAYYFAGLAYEESGRVKDAISHYETFLDLWEEADTGRVELQDARDRLEKLRQVEAG